MSQSDSQIAELKQEDAVSALFAELLDYTQHICGKAELQVKTESDTNLFLHLPSLVFRFRLDKITAALGFRLLCDLLYTPLAGIVQAVLSAGVTKLEQHAHASSLIELATSRKLVTDLSIYICRRSMKRQNSQST